MSPNLTEFQTPDFVGSYFSLPIVAVPAVAAATSVEAAVDAAAVAAAAGGDE